jgi:hypothetical protein
MPVLISALLLTAALGSGVSFVARQSSPGDLLYPFEVSINQKVEARIAAFHPLDSATASVHAASAFLFK